MKMDIIRIKNLSVPCRIGVSPAERRRPRTVLVNVALGVDLRRAGKTDNLSDTVDYAQLAGEILAAARGSTFALLESLAERIAGICLGNRGVAAARVAVAKTGVPGIPAAAVEVELDRPRGKSGAGRKRAGATHAPAGRAHGASRNESGR